MSEANNFFPLDEHALRQVIDEAPNGIVIVDSTAPLFMQICKQNLCLDFNEKI